MDRGGRRRPRAAPASPRRRPAPAPVPEPGCNARPATVTVRAVAGCGPDPRPAPGDPRGGTVRAVPTSMRPTEPTAPAPGRVPRDTTGPHQVTSPPLDTRTRRDRRWFTSVYEEHYGQVLAYLTRRSDRATAQDMAAEVFLRAWTTRESLRGAPLPWLYGISRNVVLEFYRGRERDRDAREAVAGRERRRGTSPDEASAVDLHIDVAQAMGSLSEADREILTLHTWEDLDPADIATVLGVTRGSARVRLHRARRRLARALGADGTGG